MERCDVESSVFRFFAGSGVVASVAICDEVKRCNDREPNVCSWRVCNGKHSSTKQTISEKNGEVRKFIRVLCLICRSCAVFVDSRCIVSGKGESGDLQGDVDTLCRFREVRNAKPDGDSRS